MFLLVLRLNWSDFNNLLRGRGRAVRRGRRPPDLVGHVINIFSCDLCASAPNTDIGNKVQQCSSFKRASRSLAKTGFFGGPWRSLFRIRFLCCFLRGLEGSFGTLCLHLELIWASFWITLGVF